MMDLAAEAFLFCIEIAEKLEHKDGTVTKTNHNTTEKTFDGAFWEPPKTTIDSVLPPEVVEWVKKKNVSVVENDKAVDELIPQVVKDQDFAYKTHYLQERTLTILLKNDLQIDCDAADSTSTSINLDTCTFASLGKAAEVKPRPAPGTEGLLDADDHRPPA
ncbi:hypothetical protein RJ55_07431 [Drechmeria coniospora]|nr:hypothetical protein RJ55_07431 [Drechmeria coniospora]